MEYLGILLVNRNFEQQVTIHFSSGFHDFLVLTMQRIGFKSVKNDDKSWSVVENYPGKIWVNQ